MARKLKLTTITNWPQGLKVLNIQSTLTGNVSFAAAFSEQPPYCMEEDWNDTKRCNKKRFFVILHHQEIHMILPDLFRILLYLLEHIAVKQTQNLHIYI
jgi:hypothetical protein